MARQTVRQVLRKFHPRQEVILDVYVDGASWACSLRDGFRTAEDCLLGVQGPILRAKVSEVKEQTWYDRFGNQSVTSKVLVVDLAK